MADNDTLRQHNEKNSGRFVMPNEKRAYEISEIRENHLEIIRRVVLGEKNTEIAFALSMSPEQVSNIRNSEIVQAHIGILEAARDASTLDVSRQIAKVAPKALGILKATVDRTNKMVNEDPTFMPNSLQLNVAKDLLDRAGHGAIHRQHTITQNAQLTDDELIEIKRNVALAKSKANIANVEEAQVED